jgi:hypothetical protein
MLLQDCGIGIVADGEIVADLPARAHLREQLVVIAVLSRK